MSNRPASVRPQLYDGKVCTYWLFRGRIFSKKVLKNDKIQLFESDCAVKAEKRPYFVERQD
jgi:hypothetical protein